MKVEGNILKMRSELSDPIQYWLPIGDEEIALNSYIGEKVSLSFKGQINCIATGEKIAKSFNQGYSYKSFQTLAQCDSCIMRPELCHYDKGTCREPKWGENNCMIPHIVYLANTSEAKVGITRETQIPTRWIDQGASYALPILKVENRLTSGLIEVEMKKVISDKTHWQKMLKNELMQVDLIEKREELFGKFEYLIDDFDAVDLDGPVVELKFPVLEYPKKVKSMNFDKLDLIEGTLLGIKGQYWILDTGVVNIRRHQGYYLYFQA